jgi:hypothetical protein
VNKLRLFKLLSVLLVFVVVFLSGCSSKTDEKDYTIACTLLIECKSINENLDKFDKNKKDIVPKDGIIFKEKTIYFKDGESVFDLLVRECKKNKIHLDFDNNSALNSSYIKGIANIYEFDAGATSGWLFKVNGKDSSVGSNQVKLKKDDKILWYYSCDYPKEGAK